ncbi:MAG: type II toxin-antitoxin system PemK/MazF family toxin, partial [Syntrophomonadaceae bacterium]|nr:type II toxin-antitoxin system PemK/MazF family toxin [Syntrophomonadaceae bacterium]NLV21966.1 type II toxin-antitoxin system PemK/MazF family toxin [Syntrophomonadaceae bacterium]
QIITIDKERLMKKIGTLDNQRMAKINEAIKISLEIQ